MNKINYILITLLLGGSVSLNAQTSKSCFGNAAGRYTEHRLPDERIFPDQQLLYQQVNASAFEKSPYIDISKALYGKVAGLNVYQGTGSSADNISTLSLHGNAPLVLIDGFPRDISDITSMEIESCYVLKCGSRCSLRYAWCEWSSTGYD